MFVGVFEGAELQSTDGLWVGEGRRDRAHRAYREPTCWEFGGSKPSVQGASTPDHASGVGSSSRHIAGSSCVARVRFEVQRSNRAGLDSLPGLTSGRNPQPESWRKS